MAGALVLVAAVLAASLLGWRMRLDWHGEAFRWPWQATVPAGMVEIDETELLRLYRDALRAADLRAEVGVLEGQHRLVEAQNEARRLLTERPYVFAAWIERDAREALMDELPLTTQGALHAEAFCALLTERLWAARDAALIDQTPAAQADHRTEEK